MRYYFIPLFLMLLLAGCTKESSSPAPSVNVLPVVSASPEINSYAISQRSLPQTLKNSTYTEVSSGTNSSIAITLPFTFTLDSMDSTLSNDSTLSTSYRFFTTKSTTSDWSYPSKEEPTHHELIDTTYHLQINTPDVLLSSCYDGSIGISLDPYAFTTPNYFYFSLSNTNLSWFEVKASIQKVLSAGIGDELSSYLIDGGIDGIDNLYGKRFELSIPTADNNGTYLFTRSIDMKKSDEGAITYEYNFSVNYSDIKQQKRDSIPFIDFIPEREPVITDVNIPQLNTFFTEASGLDKLSGYAQNILGGTTSTGKEMPVHLVKQQEYVDISPDNTYSKANNTIELESYSLLDTPSKITITMNEILKEGVLTSSFLYNENMGSFDVSDHDSEEEIQTKILNMVNFRLKRLLPDTSELHYHPDLFSSQHSLLTNSALAFNDTTIVFNLYINYHQTKENKIESSLGFFFTYTELE